MFSSRAVSRQQRRTGAEWVRRWFVIETALADPELVGDCLYANAGFVAVDYLIQGCGIEAVDKPL